MLSAVSIFRDWGIDWLVFFDPFLELEHLDLFAEFDQRFNFFTVSAALCSYLWFMGQVKLPSRLAAWSTSSVVN
ncbi:MAG TPA: hypothetical protein DCM07_26590 [Planctomycetaceae bacterium]|nr:hypothetical protein [Gimesia sp.]HAH48349.1 hypothetical protein [Planctomycetaceae bacterium]|tara:strand:+ start:393 stop:614 length:222 start_codon:yes stop_codon:yes gene_type:complete